MGDAGGRPIDVLLVEDDENFAGLAVEKLGGTDSSMSLECVTTGDQALETIADGGVDCVVADYALPERTGIDLLEAVRADNPELPFILYTGKGSESVASDAISAGVTDYLQKEPGGDQFALLANRITNAVASTRARDEVETATQRYDALFEHATDAIARIEYDDETPIVESVNPAFVDRFVEGDPDEVIGRDVDEVVESARERTPVRTLTKQLSNGQFHSTELTVHSGDGPIDFYLELVPIHGERSGGSSQSASGGEEGPADESFESAFAVYRNVSDQHLHEERFRSFVEQSTDIITVLDEAGIATYQSPSFERIAGYDPESMIGENMFEYIHPDDRTHAMEQFQKGLEDPDLTPVAEYRFQHADGSYRWFESRGNYQFDNPLVQGFVVNSRDVTERKEREEELKRQNERLDAFGSIVSHDIRNPLNVAGGHLELAMDECDSEHLEQVALAHDRIEELLDQLLSIARIGDTAIEREPVDLDEIASRAWSTVETEDATLSCDAEGVVLGDRSRLQEVFENLFSNAVEHAGADVAVTVDDHADDPGFYVADDGPGIPESDREQVFESGFTTTDDGTGFGLSIVNEIVDAHDWRVEITESDDDGTRLDFHDVERPES
jgi:PAS domain S-box-containing protein